MDGLAADCRLDEITIELIETVPIAQVKAREEYWISHYRAQDCNLVNTHHNRRRQNSEHNPRAGKSCARSDNTYC